MINEILKFLADVLNFLASAVDGRGFERLGKYFAEQASKLAQKAGVVTLPSKSDVASLASSVLTIISNESSSAASWPNENLKVVMTAILASLTYVTDTVSHNEKFSEFENNQKVVIKALDGILDRIASVKIAKTPWSNFIEIVPKELQAQRLPYFWNECCQMQITLKNGCGLVTLYNVKNTFNGYNVASSVVSLGAAAITLVNIYYICNSPTSTPAPTSFASSFAAPSMSPTAMEPDISTHLSSTAAAPLRLIFDTMLQCFSYEKSKMEQFFSGVIKSFEKELAGAKAGNRSTKPLDFPQDLILIANMFGFQESLIDSAKKMKEAYSEYNFDVERDGYKKTIADTNTKKSEAETKLQSALDLLQQSDAHRLAAENDKQSAVESLQQSEAQRLAAENDKQTAIMAQRKAEESIRENHLTIAQQEQTIEKLADKIKQLENDLQQFSVASSEKNDMIESLLTLILQNFIVAHGLSNNERRSFIEQLKEKIGDNSSPMVQKMLHDLEASLTSKEQISSEIINASRVVVESFVSLANPPELKRSDSNSSARPPLPPLVTPAARRFSYLRDTDSPESIESIIEGVRKRHSSVSSLGFDDKELEPKNHEERHGSPKKND